VEKLEFKGGGKKCPGNFSERTPEEYAFVGPGEEGEKVKMPIKAGEAENRYWWYSESISRQNTNQRDYLGKK